MKKDINKEIVEIANRVLNQELGSIEASRTLIRLFYQIKKDDDKNLMVFKALDSETDHLPLGKLRENYSPNKLEVMDNEVKSYEHTYRESINLACKNIIKKFGN